MALTSTQIENIQIDYGRIYINYGETGERALAPTRGGGIVTITKSIRDIEFDGRRGKTAGMQVVDEINAMVSVPLLDTSMDNLALAMPWATYSSNVITAESANLGVIPDSAYLINIVMIAKVLGGSWKKFTLKKPSVENDFSLTAAPKSEGVAQLEFHAHWDPEDDTADLFTIEDLETIGADSTAPTVVTVPADADVDVVATSNLTATFSEDIRQSDIKADNFTLVKADGTAVAGALTYTLATKTATFNPTASLDAGGVYIWIISGVRDLAGNVMTKVVVNFTVAS